MNSIEKLSQSSTDDIKLIELIHLVSNIFSGGFLGVLCIGLYLLVKKDITPEIRNVCYDIINFNLSFIIYFVTGFLLMLLLIGLIIVPVLYIIWLSLLILGAIKHFAGERYIYPMTITFLK